ncbi:hypothetical protein FXO38_36572 [Capsicum annuum]|nr:hypothetical protein FXO38_36572 [Capsicum annuum]
MESIKPRIQAMMEILITKYGGEGSSNGDIEVTECGGEDSISCHSGPQTEQDTNSFDVFQSVPERLEAKANLISVLEIQVLMIKRFVSGLGLVLSSNFNADE